MASAANAAVVYCRISEDRKGQELGIQRQLADCEGLAASRGWNVLGRFTDNDISAYSGKHRPGFERMLAEAESGAFSHVICWETSRLTRGRVERAQMFQTFARLHVGIVPVKGPELALDSAAGGLLADILGAMDSHESAVKSERVSRAALQRAEAGKPHAQIGYGWGSPQEAETVRLIVDKLLAGVSAHALVNDLNKRGVAGPRGQAWQRKTLLMVASRPSNIAKRVYRGEIIGAGNWPPLVDESKHARIVAMLNNPDRQRGRRPGKRAHLLTYGSQFRCGGCGGVLSARQEYRERKGVKLPKAEWPWVYRCPAPVKGKPCVSRKMADVDGVVAANVIARFQEPDASKLFDTDDLAQAARERVEGLRARLNNAADDYAAGAIDSEQLRRITAGLRPQLAEAEGEARRHGPAALPEGIEALTGKQARAFWDGLPVAGKRLVLEALGVSVTVTAQGGGRGFDPDSVKFNWG